LDRIYATLMRFDPGLRVWLGRYFWLQRSRIVSDLALISEVARPTDVVLEVGSLPSLVHSALSHLGYRVVGVDIAPHRQKEAINALGLTCIGCDIEHRWLPFADASFDLVCVNEVFEHLRVNLIRTSAELRRVLKPGGTLIVSTPNLMEAGRLFKLLVLGETVGIYDQWQTLETLGHMGHVREYTKTDVRKFFGRMGFQCQREQYVGAEDWGLQPTRLARCILHRVFPWTRRWFALVLKKEPRGDKPGAVCP